ncbi:MAG TPA: hypothetical protein VJ647_00085, partial [Chitinophagaceae bacterium]|nr:hypothetical protein [Chitinophagaceae bacterium]
MKARSCLPVFLLVLLSFQATTTMAYSKPDRKKIENMTTEEKKVRLEEIRMRVNEIRDMDRFALSREERKALKEE